MHLTEALINAIKWDENGLIPAIVQDAESGHVLMMAYMNADSLQQSLQQNETVFYSRRRREIWHKGATSGNVQHIQEIYVDCDADTLLVLVNPSGPACHTGARSCFYRSLREFADNSD